MVKKKGFDFTVLLVILFFLWEFAIPIACAKGQTITIRLSNSSNGCAQTPGAFPTYLGKYVYCGGTWGAVQLDTEASSAIELTSLQKCGFNPSPASGWYIKGDCNGVSGYKAGTSNGSPVLQVLNLTGNCSAQYRDVNCGNKAPAPYPVNLFFAVGSLAYLGADNMPAVIPSVQTSDLQGRKWNFLPVNPPTWAWTVASSGPTATPTPTLTGTPPTPTATTTMPVISPTLTRTAIGQPTPTPTACSNQSAPWGRVGPFLACYDCQGNPTNGVPPANPQPGQPCGPPGATPTRTPTSSGGGGGGTVTPAFTPTPTPNMVCVTTTPVKGAIVVPFRTPQ